MPKNSDFLTIILRKSTFGVFSLYWMITYIIYNAQYASTVVEFI